MWWLDLVIVILLIQAAANGYLQGGILAIAEAIGFVVATSLALVLSPYLGRVIKTGPVILRPYAVFLAFIIIWSIVQTFWLIISGWLLATIPKDVRRSIFNHLIGAVAGLVKTLVILIIGLMLVLSLPLSATTKANLTDRTPTKQLIGIGNRYEGLVTHWVGSDLAGSLDFLTVHRSKNETNIPLGFTTTGNPSAHDEQAMLILVNNERASRGLKPLKFSTALQAVARAHSVDMLAKGYFSHVNLTGQDPFDRIEAAGIHFEAAGENLALAPTLSLAHTGLMNSPEHKANILSPDFGQVGIGIIVTDHYGIMVTQDFMN